MRYGYKFVSPFGAVVLITSIHYYQRYMPLSIQVMIRNSDYPSSYLVFLYC